MCSRPPHTEGASAFDSLLLFLCLYSCLYHCPVVFLCCCTYLSYTAVVFLCCCTYLSYTAVVFLCCQTYLFYCTVMVLCFILPLYAILLFLCSCIGLSLFHTSVPLFLSFQTTLASFHSLELDFRFLISCFPTLPSPNTLLLLHSY
jgi:hypothetical protein